MSDCLVTHTVEHYPREQFLYFLGLWAMEYERQTRADWAKPYFAEIEKTLAQLEGKVEAYQ